MLLPEAAVGATYVEIVVSDLDRLRIDERPAFVYFMLPQPRRMAADCAATVPEMHNHKSNPTASHLRVPYYK